jgi:cell wall-associated NlpC family hydrolase
VTVLLASGLAIVATPTVSGAQTASKQKQAEELTNQIEAADLEVSALAEKLNAAVAKRDAAQATVKDTEAQIATAEAEVDRILDLVQQNLASLYRRTLRGSTGADFDFSDATDLLKRGQYSQAQASRDDELLEKLDAAQQDLATARNEAARVRDIAAAESEQINAAKTAIEAARAEQQKLLDSIKGELAAAVAAEQARRAAATVSKFAGGPVNYPNVGPPNGSASQAIAFARGVIGSGYSTSPREGPTYDCSGLTKSAWGAAGVSIGNASGDQFRRWPQIPIAAAQPGDLIFWGPGGGSHVALYVGGGMIIDASSSQGRVVERPIWGSPSGAVRVT